MPDTQVRAGPILFVGVSTADQRRADGQPPETLLRPGDRPWRRKKD